MQWCRFNPRQGERILFLFFLNSFLIIPSKSTLVQTHESLFHLHVHCMYCHHCTRTMMHVPDFEKRRPYSLYYVKKTQTMTVHNQNDNC